jgi:hypothetical protein
MGAGRGNGMRNRGRQTGRFSFGSGFSRFGRGAIPTGELDPEMERKTLEQEAIALQAQLKAVQDRLAAMEKSTSER